MVWIYILSFIIVIGIAINVRTYNNYKAKEMNKMKINDKNINVL